MISELFNIIKDYGEYVAVNQLDGFKYWQYIKKFINENNNVQIINGFIEQLKIDWNIKININDKISYNKEEIYNYVYNVLEIYGNDDSEDDKKRKNFEQYHFFLQLIRLPKKCKFEVLKVLQIAYNLGQLEIHMHRDIEQLVYKNTAREYFFRNNLKNINSYISEDITTGKDLIDELNEEILKIKKEFINTKKNI